MSSVLTSIVLAIRVQYWWNLENTHPDSIAHLGLQFVTPCDPLPSSTSFRQKSTTKWGRGLVVLLLPFSAHKAPISTVLVTTIVSAALHYVMTRLFASKSGLWRQVSRILSLPLFHKILTCCIHHFRIKSIRDDRRRTIGFRWDRYVYRWKTEPCIQQPARSFGWAPWADCGVFEGFIGSHQNRRQ